MPYVVATADGLIQIDDRGRMNRLADGPFLHVVPGEEDGEAGGLDEQGQIWDVDADGAAPYESFEVDRAKCLLVDGADVWLGTEPAGLFRFTDDGFKRIEGFDVMPTHERWTTP